MISLGKNKITKLLKDKKKILGSNTYYNYHFYKFKEEINLNINCNKCFVYILDGKNKNQNLKVNNNLINFKKGELIKIKKKKSDAILINTKHTISILIVYNKEKSNKEKRSSFEKFKNFYTVKKPWGYEQWLTGAYNKNFAFKKIFLKKGSKTSLQYHVKKIETNFLYSGNANLHYCDQNLPLLKKYFFKILNSTKKKKIAKGSIINVKPKTIHRIEAISNLTLFEVSSPHLSDVVRVSDDSNRPDGKIKDEHKKNS